MSLQQNTEWIEAAKENFEQAIASQNFSLAQDIISDMKDAGINVEIEQFILDRELVAKKMTIHANE